MTHTVQITEMQRRLIIKALKALDADDSSEEYDVECLLAELEDFAFQAPAVLEFPKGA